MLLRLGLLIFALICVACQTSSHSGAETKGLTCVINGPCTEGEPGLVAVRPPGRSLAANWRAVCRMMIGGCRAFGQASDGH